MSLITYQELPGRMRYVKSKDYHYVLGHVMSSLAPGYKFIGVWDLSKEQTGVPTSEPHYHSGGIFTPWFLSRGNLSSSCSKLEVLAIYTSTGDKFLLNSIFRGLIDAPSILFIGEEKPNEQFLSKLAECREGFHAIPKDDIISRALFIIQGIGMLPEKKICEVLEKTSEVSEKKINVADSFPDDIMDKKIKEVIREIDSVMEERAEAIKGGTDNITEKRVETTVEKKTLLSDKVPQDIDQSNMVLKVGQEMDELKQIFKSLREGQEKGNSMISQISSRMDSSDAEIRKISTGIAASEEEMRKISSRIDEEKEERKKDAEEITGLRDLLIENSETRAKDAEEIKKISLQMEEAKNETKNIARQLEDYKKEVVEMKECIRKIKETRDPVYNLPFIQSFSLPSSNVPFTSTASYRPSIFTRTTSQFHSSSSTSISSTTSISHSSILSPQVPPTTPRLRYLTKQELIDIPKMTPGERSKLAQTKEDLGIATYLIEVACTLGVVLFSKPNGSSPEMLAEIKDLQLPWNERGTCGKPTMSECCDKEEWSIKEFGHAARKIHHTCGATTWENARYYESGNRRGRIVTHARLITTLRLYFDRCGGSRVSITTDGKLSIT